MFILMSRRVFLKMDVVRLKSRSLGQIKVIACLHYSDHIFSPIFLKLAQNLCVNKYMVPFENGCGQVKMKVTRSNLS